jgi:mRNA interferase RelE/StbE
LAEELSYSVIIEKKAQKEAIKIPSKYRARIDKAIQSLATNPREHHTKKLTEKEGYRLRAGNYRILCTIDDKAKTIVIYRTKIERKNAYN